MTTAQLTEGVMGTSSLGLSFSLTIGSGFFLAEGRVFLKLYRILLRRNTLPMMLGVAAVSKLQTTEFINEWAEVENGA